jgi:hypothetical protein
MASPRRLWPLLESYTPAVSSEHCELEWKRLGSEAVFRGRRCGLSPLVRSMALVTHGLGQKHAESVWCTRHVELVLVVLVHRRAERVWREGEVSMPWLFVQTTG